MSLPSLDQYNEAVQNPKTAFRDGQLKTGKVQVNGHGLPLALSGGFALTYNLTCHNGRQYAIRCFHKQTDRLEQRYEQIAMCLKQTRSPYFVEFEYQREGVHVNKEWYPIVKMEWARGRPLGAFLERYYSHAKAITRLREQFVRLAVDLRQQGIAHGDLQNGNVMVDGDTVRLIDYDGMYVRGMAPGSGAELGHKHFQHPGRTTGVFGPEIDRFSFIVIDVSLHALLVMPSLFERYSNAENIIFTANDFVQPQQSSLFQELLAHSALNATAQQFAALCANDLRTVPTLDEFLRVDGMPSGRPTLVPVAPGQIRRPKYNGALPVISAENFWEVQRNIGNRVEIIGKVTEVHWNFTAGQRPYVFVNFGDWHDNIVKVSIWSEGLEQLSIKPDSSWAGKWVSVTGMVDPAYTSAKFGYTHLSITVMEQSQLHLLPKEEAEYRLGIVPQKIDEGAGGTGAPTKRTPASQVLPPKSSPRAPSTPSGKRASAPGSAAPKPPPTATEARNQQVIEKLRQGLATTTQGGKQSTSGSPTSKPGGSGCLVAVLIVGAIVGVGAILGNRQGGRTAGSSSNGVGARSSHAPGASRTPDTQKGTVRDWGQS